ANQVGEHLGFDKDDNALTVYWADGKRELAFASKTALARQLVEVIAERYRARGKARSSVTNAKTSHAR
ncbi:MAG: hypothetical protein ACREUC_06060, partial [Steroidobacteraceae bacterium]